jgi:hypothetical protein
MAWKIEKIQYHRALKIESSQKLSTYYYSSKVLTFQPSKFPFAKISNLMISIKGMISRRNLLAGLFPLKKHKYCKS